MLSVDLQCSKMASEISTPPILFILFKCSYTPIFPGCPRYFEVPFAPRRTIAICKLHCCSQVKAICKLHCSRPVLGMSSSDSYSESQQAGSDVNLLSVTTQDSDNGNFRLPTEVLETLMNYSVSSPGGWLSDDIRHLQEEFRDEDSLLNGSPGSARAARLQALAGRQRSRLNGYELDIAAYSQHQTVAENANSALADRIAGISTAHVLVCLERDRLRRIIRVGVCVVVVLVIIILVFAFRVSVGRIMHTR